MKKHLTYILAFVILPLFITGCDSDDQANVNLYELLNYPIDADEVQKLNREENACFVWTGNYVFRKDDYTNGSWEQIDLSEYSGWSSAMPQQIIFSNGEYICPFEMWHSSGPHPLMIPWDAYKKSSYKDITPMLASPFEIDSDNRTITMSNLNITIEKFESDKFTLSRQSNYTGGRTGKGGEEMEIKFYERRGTADLNSTLILIAHSEKELCAKMINLMREHFGNTIDLNKIYAPSIIFDQGTVSIDDLGKEVEEWYSTNNE